MKLEEYTEQLRFIAEKLAYVAFTDDASDLLENRGASEEDIKNFNVNFFFTNYINDDGEVDTDFIVRFSVFLNTDNNQEITFLFNNDVVKRAIIDKVYKSEFDKAYVQHHMFSFGKPNIIELYDAQFILENKLDLGEEW